jgi:hypothetical protein
MFILYEYMNLIYQALRSGPSALTKRFGLKVYKRSSSAPGFHRERRSADGWLRRRLPRDWEVVQSRLFPAGSFDGRGCGWGWFGAWYFGQLVEANGGCETATAA